MLKHCSLKKQASQGEKDFVASTKRFVTMHQKCRRNNLKLSPQRFWSFIKKAVCWGNKRIFCVDKVYVLKYFFSSPLERKALE